RLEAFPPTPARGEHDWCEVRRRANWLLLTDSVGTVISAANNSNQVIVAIADAMRAHDQLFNDARILHRGISDSNICFRGVGGDLAGILSGFGDAIMVADEHRTRPDMAIIRAIQPILSLVSTRAPRTRLDDWECLLYLVICLGTYGINDNERRAFFDAFSAADL
ncbi:hypothetical protein IWW47_004392, partial [Coemansia sp. RSA 2052]